ncbi:MAG TPA: selenocysteine-specific translation elongation factor [Mycobacteriales bacterium]|nr:selenocysteine-specific translation elongation factor [Mycobacteriales bacterium]
MHVVATAGHVDHGKSTLVRALTGTDPDRWAEERRRGLTIDLGYAWTALPSGQVLAFVDVPGHARFIGNMLAGVGPAPAVLLVVAADEGWRRQSGEHLAAVDALAIEHGLLVVTRSDLADPAPALTEARQHVARSSLGHVEAVTASGATGRGLDDLRAALDRLVARLPRPDAAAPVRLWVDRAFTVRGTGTVVTGTLTAGTLRVGDELELAGRPVPVRGLQSLGRACDEVPAAARVAVALRGVGRLEVERGQTLRTPGAWHDTAELDVRLRAGEAAGPLPERLVLHVGTAAVAARLRPLGDDTARVRLERPLPLRAGDRALLRDPAAQLVAAGLEVLDADPPALRRRGAATARAEQLRSASGTPDLVAEVARRGAVRRHELVALGVRLDRAADVRVVGDWLVDARLWQRWRAALRAAVAAHEAAAPLERGLPREAARRAVGVPDAALVAALADDDGLVSAGGRLRTTAGGGLGPAEDAVRALELRLRDHQFAAPERSDLDRLGLGPREIAAAAVGGRLLRLRGADGGDVVLLPDAPDRAAEVLSGLDQPFTLSAARQALGTTRRVAVPLLEHLDALGRTRRVDPARRVVVR